MPSPVITVAQMRKWEQSSWAAGISKSEVIETVGLRIAEWLNERVRSDERVLLLAGKGNNGSDVRHILPHLECGNARLLDVLDPALALDEFRTLSKQGVDWIIDGLFGIGLNRPLDSHWRHLIGAINQTSARIVAVDVPSGIDASSGAIQGAAIEAETTLTLGAVKDGLLNSSALSSVGRLELIPEIGLISCPHSSQTQWLTVDDFDGYPPRRKPQSHKGTYGHLGIIAGSEGFHGAAVLAARAAAQAQPGLITVQTHSSAYLPVACQLQSQMVRKWSRTDAITSQLSCLLIGPGLAAPECEAEMRESVEILWREFEHPMIVDASALGWLPTGTNKTGAVRVITPHPGEAARLLGCSAAEIQKNRRDAASQLSAAFGNCHVVLKGHQTIITETGSPILVNSTGNPSLAQGGSGDILAGFIGGILAQPELASDPMKAVSYAVNRHGQAADELSSIDDRWPIDTLPTFL